MIKPKKIIKYIIVFIGMILIFTNFSYALDTGAYSDIYHNDGGQSTITNVAGTVLGVVQTIGMASSLIFLVILGIKYIMSAPNDKATIKERAVVYVTGAVIMFGASAFIGLIANWTQNTIK